MRKRTLLITLLVIAFGLIGTGLSTLLKQNEYIGGSPRTVKESYGFPLGWYGYSHIISIMPVGHPVMVYWFSLESFLLDIAFWFAISSIGCLAIIKSTNMLHKTRASKNLPITNI